MLLKRQRQRTGHSFFGYLLKKYRKCKSASSLKSYKMVFKCYITQKNRSLRYKNKHGLITLDRRSFHLSLSFYKVILKLAPFKISG